MGLRLERLGLAISGISKLLGAWIQLAGRNGIDTCTRGLDLLDLARSLYSVLAIGISP